MLTKRVVILWGKPLILRKCFRDFIKSSRNLRIPFLKRQCSGINAKILSNFLTNACKNFPKKEAMTLCPESLQIFKKSLQACRGMKNLCRDYCRSKNYNRKECQIYLPCCKLLDSGVLNLQPLFKYLVRLSEKSLQRCK